MDKELRKKIPYEVSSQFWNEGTALGYHIDSLKSGFSKIPDVKLQDKVKTFIALYNDIVAYLGNE